MDSRATITDIADAPSYHGGNLNAARALFPDAPEPWIDLSTGINPEPYPVAALPSSAWSRLPEAADFAALEAAAGRAYGAGHAADVVAAPGTQSIIQWLPYLFPARRVGILDLTYGEHGQCWRTGGAETVMAHSLEELARCDTGVIVNPNNPDGRIVAPSALAALAATYAARGGLLVVDEAFMDVVRPGASLIPTLPPAGAIVLRSFGKTYGLAGLRLGFAVAAPDIGARLRAALGPWAVSGPALEIGQRALTDTAWLDSTVLRLEGDAARLDRLLIKAGFGIKGGTPLFRLAAHDRADRWFVQLGHAGILTRPFPQNPGILRFGIPYRESGWARLEAALGPTPALI